MASTPCAAAAGAGRSQHHPTLNNLQLLRALAALLVAGYHALETVSWHAHGVAIPNIGSGSGGVITLFFAISGFLMVHITPAGEAPAWFLAKRAARIVPLYWACLLGVLACKSISDWAFITADTSAASIASAFLFLPWPDLTGNFFPILGVGWTLNYEAPFYLLFALTLAMPAGWRPAALIALTLAGICGFSVLAGETVYGRFYGNAIILDFVAGAGLAYLIRWRPVAGFIRRTPMLWVALAAAATWLAFEFFGAGIADSHWRYWAPAMMLLFAAVGQDVYRKPTGQSPLTYLGDISYSIYLLHPFILAIMAPIWFRLLGTGPATSMLLLPAVLIGSIALAALSYERFEKPANKLARSFLRRALRIGPRQATRPPSASPAE